MDYLPTYLPTWSWFCCIGYCWEGKKGGRERSAPSWAKKIWILKEEEMSRCEAMGDARC